MNLKIVSYHNIFSGKAGSLWILLFLLMLTGCQSTGLQHAAEQAVRGRPHKDIILETTGYCPCGKCCNWKLNWFGRPVNASGPSKGTPKKVGFTAGGRRAQPGTLAADTRLFPFGTIMFIPGYGYGRAEDRGKDIQGYEIDLFFRTHNEALRWGRVKKKIKVWYCR
ncbi:MAG: 3D domain-containing protein [Lentisphaerota bacterium]